MNTEARDDAVLDSDMPFAVFSKEETTLAVLPFFSLEYGNQHPSYHLAYETKLSGLGIEATLNWQVSADPTYGYPDAFDRKVFKAIEHTGLSGRRPVLNPVRFSLRQILQLLGMAPFPTHFARIRSSIRRIAAVTVQSRLSYLTAAKNGKITRTFHLYDSVSFNDASERDEIVTDDHWIELGDWYLQTLDQPSIPESDPIYFQQLRHPLATRLYEVLTVKFSDFIQNRLSGWRTSYLNLCRILPAQPVALSPQRHLEIGHRPLIATGFLAEVLWEKMDGNWMILYTPGPRAKSMYAPKPDRRPNPKQRTVSPAMQRTISTGNTETEISFSRLSLANTQFDEKDTQLLPYWGLSERPFDTTPNPRFFFATAQHDAARFKLGHGVATCAGAIQLTGDVGCGKTVLLRTFIQDLDPEKYEVALLTNPRWDGVALLREVLYQLGHPAESTDKNHILRNIEEVWLKTFQAGKHTVLIIDEAQLIADAAAFEELRLLLNFQMDDRNLATLILSGQPELGLMIRAIPQFEQRMVFRHHLYPLSDVETRDYIRHRLEVAG
ncbi:MAG: AAA family ATPase, partial [candidate division Zixibacteria bacterium]|nr:AAA family ATPase [candidate division Zixibacteria bacterium]